MADFKTLKRDMARAMNDDALARFVLGDPGEHFDAAEWERRKAALVANPGAYLRDEEKAK